MKDDYMRLKQYYILATFCIISLLSAQHQHGGKGGGRPSGCEIYGTVIDSISGQPIEYTSISIIDSDKSIATGGITDSDGKFEIEEIKPGEYDVKIEFMGFSPVIFSDIKLSSRGQRVKDLGTIKLVPTSLLLEAVKVIDDKPIFEFEADKMIYNSSDDIVSGSGTAEDVLNKVPMVTVDQDGQISLRGNPNVKILINGRPNRSGGDVDNIPASLIDKVEIITSPSAKYDPEGMAGIINIVLIKGKYEGLNGSVKVNGKHNKFNSFEDMNGFTFYSNYQTDNYNVYSSYSINNRKRTQEGFRRVNHINHNLDNLIFYPDTLFLVLADGVIDTLFTPNYDYSFLSDADVFGQSFKIGSDYSLTENTTINVEAIYKNHYKTKLNTQEYFQQGIDEPNAIDGEGNPIFPFSKISNEGEDEDNFHSEVFFELLQSFDNPDKEMSLSFAYDYGKDFEFEMSDKGDRTDIDEIEGSFEIDFNYKFPIGEKEKFEFGYDGRFNDSQEDMDFELSREDNPETEEVDESWNFSGKNDFNYSREIHGFFAEYQLEVNNNFIVKPSFRVEYVNKDINFEIKDTTKLEVDSESIYVELLRSDFEKHTEIKEFNFFPDFHFTYNLTDKKSIQFGVSKRIERPGGGGHGGGWGQLRPFPRNIYNDSFIMIGNPHLKPEFSTQYELSYKSPIPMGFYYTNVYYRNVTDPIEWYINREGSSGNTVTFRNAEGGTDYGLEFFFMVMGQTLGGGYNINELKDASGDFQLNGKNEHMNMYMRINLPEEQLKLFSYEFGFYYMKMKQPGGTLFGNKGTLWANTGISKSLFNDRASLSFSINNIFDMGGFQMDYLEPIGPDNSGISEKTEIEVSRGGRTFSLSLKYNFGKMQEEKRNGRGNGDDGGMDMGY